MLGINSYHRKGVNTHLPNTGEKEWTTSLKSALFYGFTYHKLTEIPSYQRRGEKKEREKDFNPVTPRQGHPELDGVRQEPFALNVCDSKLDKAQPSQTRATRLLSLQLTLPI